MLNSIILAISMTAADPLIDSAGGDNGDARRNVVRSKVVVRNRVAIGSRVRANAVDVRVNSFRSVNAFHAQTFLAPVVQVHAAPVIVQQAIVVPAVVVQTFAVQTFAVHSCGGFAINAFGGCHSGFARSNVRVRVR